MRAPDNQKAFAIGPDDPPPFEFVNPDGTAPLMLICDHACNYIPPAMERLGLHDWDMERHIAYDIGAGAVTRALAARLGAPAMLTRYSRLLIDVNRTPGDPGSIPAVSDNTPVPGNTGLSEAEQEARIEALFWPYHHAVTNAVAHLWRIGPAPALFSVHSFTPSLGGEDRYWHVGVLWNRDPRLAIPLIHRLRDAGDLHVGDNEPYSGREIAYSIDLHAGAAGLPNCAVEIRQDQIETPEGVARWAGLLGDALENILAIESLHRVEHY